MYYHKASSQLESMHNMIAKTRFHNGMRKIRDIDKVLGFRDT
jgi:hypothetical protein